MVKRWGASRTVVVSVLAFLPSSGAAVDVQVVLIGHDTWKEMHERVAAGVLARQGTSPAPRAAIGLALLPREARKQHEACANGAFDDHFRAFGAGFVAQGAGDAVVRLGWDADLGSASHPWGIDGVADVRTYKGCFRSAVRALKSTAPGLRIEWSVAGGGRLPALLAYPGDDVVDVWGFRPRDSGPGRTTQEIGGRHVAIGGPWGIAAFLIEARKHGKKTSVPEGSVWERADSPGDPDDPGTARIAYP
jgi:hypothetical protein